MTLPVGAPVATVTFGPWGSEFGDGSVSGVTFQASADRAWIATGQPLAAAPDTRMLDSTGAGSIVLAVDDPGWSVTGITFTATIRLAGRAPDVRTFALPAEYAGTTVDLDLLAPATSSAGTTVSLPSVISVDGGVGVVDLSTTYVPTVTPAGGLPAFERVNGGVAIFSQATQNPAGTATAPTTASSVYFPSIVRGSDLFDDPIDEWYMYYSTNHESTHANSGIWLATAPSILGPWTGRGRKYIDNVSGSQTETPSVFKDPTGAHAAVLLYHQQTVSGAVGSQTTIWATSDDGLTWTRGGIAIDITSGIPGDGHTGYAIATTYGGTVFAHHLRGGGNYPHFGLSVAPDGRNFSAVTSLGYGRDQLPEGDNRRIEWNSGKVVQWRGQLIWVGMVANFASGGGTKDNRLVVAPISADLSYLVGPPQYVLPPTGAETTDYQSVTAVVDGSTLYVVYQIGSALYAAKAV